MVQFTKNGQGFWDFDFEVLAEQTSVEFAQKIEIELSVSQVKDIQSQINKDYVYIYFYKIYGVVIYKFNKTDYGISRDSFTHDDLGIAYKHCEKLGEILD